VLFVDDTNACLVCSVGDLLDVLCALAHGLELLVETAGRFDSSLRVEFG
jgi:hypothetical protein